jgi:GNAT superfamily N-acetyltransferase
LGGCIDCGEFNIGLENHFIEKVIPACKEEAFIVRFTTDDWIPVLEQMFAGHETFLAPRLYFEIQPEAAGKTSLPEGFDLRQVTRELLDSHIAGLDMLREEMCSERASVEDFLEKSFGLCPLYENQIAGWCLSEYNVGDRCEIGIATLEPHQRKGIATMLTKAFLTEAFERGYLRVGWDCWEKNAASVAAAQRAGFKLVTREQAMVVMV